MDILKRSISPLSDAAWNEIDEQAVKVLKSRLSGRKFVDVEGPFGWDHAVVPTGRLDVSRGEGRDEVHWGVHIVQPLVETRVSFEMDVWELDNVARGAKDLELAPLIKAAEKIASFEENAIYNGFEPGGIVGLAHTGAPQQISISTEHPRDIMAGLSEGLVFFRKNSIDGPYALVAGPQLWQIIDVFGDGYPLRKRVTSLLDGGMILALELEGGFLVSTRGGDFELTLGQDLSIGYESTVGDKVRLFIAESFTFRVIEPNAVVPLAL
ncbi:MAG TPA: family 1 encapsulin nanocompartment shell protein [Synergistales bacterium]|nr:bacteriocin [Synergistaceae bacterium]HPA58267.1 family 1 encapsulin nanocompartment shell protein [Synergistales bacterium]HQO82587.1 family 1 encapsulin nanocompartment shell protein [Synergistales bacterium]HQQ09971.1 family 1 encapsulin nanocompartment shell protein [Synergistales bacterium]